METHILFAGFEVEKYDLVNKNGSWFEVRFPGAADVFVLILASLRRIYVHPSVELNLLASRGVVAT